MRLGWSNFMMSFSCIGCVQEPALKSSVCLKNKMFCPKAASSREGNEGNEGRYGDGRGKGGTSLKKKQGCKRSLLLRPNLRKVLPHFEVEMKSEAAF